MTNVGYNYNFTEKELSARQVKVTNDLGRLALYGELVLLSGYLGEVREHDGIASGATGYIKIADDRVISTSQVEATDTFVVGNMLHFLPGGSGAAGTIVDTPTSATVPIGYCIDEQGADGAQTAVSFRPLVQGTEASPGHTYKVVKTVIAADATAGVAVDIPVGAIIVDAWAVATATVGSGAATLKIGGGGATIATGLVMAVAKAVGRLAAGVEVANLVVGAAGVEIHTANAGDRGHVYVAYI